MSSPSPVVSRVPVELSQSWAHVLAGKIPEFIDVFCLVCVDPELRYKCWGYYESTTETISAWKSRYPGCGMNVIASVRVPLRNRSEAGLKSARKEASTLLSQTVWKSPEAGFVAFRNKLAEDLTQPDKGGIAIDRVDGKTFEELLRSSGRA